MTDMTKVVTSWLMAVIIFLMIVTYGRSLSLRRVHLHNSFKSLLRAVVTGQYICEQGSEPSFIQESEVSPCP